MKYERLYNLTIEQGGATVRVKDYPDQILMPTKGFAVAKGEWGMSFPLPGKSAFDDAIDRLLGFAREKGFDALGTWVHDGEVYIDPVNVFADKQFALGVAWERGELSIFDLANKREIPIRRKK